MEWRHRSGLMLTDLYLKYQKWAIFVLWNQSIIIHRFLKKITPWYNPHLCVSRVIRRCTVIFLPPKFLPPGKNITVILLPPARVLQIRGCYILAPSVIFWVMSKTQKCSRVFRMFWMFKINMPYICQWLYVSIFVAIFRARWSAHFLNGCVSFVLYVQRLK